MLTKKYEAGDYEDLGDSCIKIDDELLFIGKREPSIGDEEAIREIAKYGIAEIKEVGENYILEQFIEFEHMHLTLEEMAILLKEIHSNNHLGNPLVHGDYSRHNTTRLGGVPKCFDFEFTHYGDPFRDIGRVVLRECPQIEDVYSFLEIYSGKIPPRMELREGLISFCDWQHLMRTRKNVPYQNVPLLRKKQIIGASQNTKGIIQAFKQNPPIEKCKK